MNILSKIDEYKVSTLYTAGALAANAAYGIYDNQYEVPERSLSRDMILTSFYAAVISVIISTAVSRRTKVIGSISSLSLWIGRLVCGVLMSNFKDIYVGEDNSLIYWFITGFGVVSSLGALIGQYIRHRQSRQAKTAEIEPVKLRFMV